MSVLPLASDSALGSLVVSPVPPLDFIGVDGHAGMAGGTALIYEIGPPFTFSCLAFICLSTGLRSTGSRKAWGGWRGDTTSGGRTDLPPPLALWENIYL